MSLKALSLHQTNNLKNYNFNNFYMYYEPYRLIYIHCNFFAKLIHSKKVSIFFFLQVTLNVIDYNSTDGDVTSLLKNYDVKVRYIKVDDARFNKVKALNIGLRHVSNSNSIVFILDLHLQLPMNIFDRIRKVYVTFILFLQ